MGLLDTWDQGLIWFLSFKCSVWVFPCRVLGFCLVSNSCQKDAFFEQEKYLKRHGHNNGSFISDKNILDNLLEKVEFLVKN